MTDSEETPLETEMLSVDESVTRPKPRRRWLYWLRDFAVVIVVAILVSAITKAFFLRSFYIPSSSMEETLQVEDRVLVNVLVPGVVPLNRGDVVVFDDRAGWLAGYPKDEEKPWWESATHWFQDLIGFGADDANEYLIKRVIGLPGDHVTCCNLNGEIEINGQPISEREYINIPSTQKNVSLVPFDKLVPEGFLFVLGDNRNNSSDSRYHEANPGQGFVSVDAVVGRAFVVSWPMKRWSWLDNYEQVFANTDK